MQRLFQLFDKEDNILLRSNLKFRTYNGCIAAEISSHQDTLSMTAPIIGISRYLVLGISKTKPRMRHLINVKKPHFLCFEA